MGRKQIDLRVSEAEKTAVEALRAELEKEAKDGRAFTKPFVTHGGKPPAPVPPST